MKNYLIIINKTLTILCVKSILENYDLENSNLYIVVTGKKYEKKIFTKQVNILFKKYKKKIFYIYIKNIELFTIKNFFQWIKIYKLNQRNHKFINQEFSKLNLINKKYEKIFFSNEYLSKYIFNFLNKNLEKNFIIHGVGDFDIFKKQNIMLVFKNYFFSLINRYFNKIKLVNINDKFYVVFKKFIIPEYNVKNIYKINIRNYKKNLNILSKEKRIKNKFLNKNFALFLINFPGFKKNSKKNERINYIKKYIELQLEEIKKIVLKNFENKKITLIIKTKPYVDYNISAIINQKSKLILKNINYKIMTRYSDNFFHVAELLLVNKNCKYLITNKGTSIYNSKTLNPKIKIILIDKILNKINSKFDFYNKFNINKREFHAEKFLKKINIK